MGAGTVFAGNTGFAADREACEALLQRALDRRERRNPCGVRMDALADTITPTGARFELSCRERTAYGKGYSLDRRESGAWRELAPVNGDYAFTAAANALYPDDPRQIAVDWTYIYGALEPGAYRIRLWDESQDIHAEFTIEEG